ncbi:MAG: 2OG-Fe(II) oxygenase [Alphaproteobacteria bacterium]|nr:2OG-Fe(II) oxygenase [Alphaproteobacteria bacterium]
MAALDLDRLAAAPLVRDPFDFVIVPGFVRREVLPALAQHFPTIARPGSYPAAGLVHRPAFRAFLAELADPAFGRALGDKLGLDLAAYPTMVTVRGRARARDGRIHTDTEDKIASALVYLNGPWRTPGGRLRLLYDSRDLDRFAAEVPPDDGTLVAFRRSERSFHGHKPFVGPRRVVQINWLRDARVVVRETARHRITARLKGLVRPRAHRP